MDTIASDVARIGAPVAAPGDACSPAQTLEEHSLFVNSSMATCAFSGLVEAQNGLASKLCRTHDQVELLQQELAQAKRSSEELAAQQRTCSAQHDQRFEEMQRQHAQLHEAMKQLVDERTSALQESHSDAVKALDAALSPQLRAMERSVEDLMASQQEMTTKTLPRWRTDVGSEVQCLKDQLAKQHEHHETVGQSRDQRLAQCVSNIDVARADFAASLSKQSADLGARITAADARCADIVESIAACNSQMGSVERRFDKALEQQLQKVEDNFAMDAKVREQLKANEEMTASLLSAFNQSNFDRMAFSERASNHIESLQIELAECRKWTEEKLLGDLTSTQSSLEQMRAEVRTRLDHDVNNLNVRYDALDAAHKEQYAAISDVDTRLTGDHALLRRKLDEESKRWESAAKLEAVAVLTAIRSDEGQRLARLEEKFIDADQERGLAAQRLAQELHAVRTDLVSQLESLESHADAAERKTKQHLERVQEAIDCLNRELHEFVQLQEAREQDSNRLEQLVVALESRVYPWRGASQRGQSPGRKFALPAQRGITDDTEGTVRTGGGYKKDTSLTDGVFDIIDKNKDGVVTRNEFRNAPVDFKSWSFAPKAPPSRPSSASKARRREEKEVGAGNTGTAPVAGAAYAAIRGKGQPMSAR